MDKVDLLPAVFTSSKKAAYPLLHKSFLSVVFAPYERVLSAIDKVYRPTKKRPRKGGIFE